MMINFSPIKFYNGAKQICKCSIKNLFERSPKHDYFLISKTEKLPISELSPSSWAVCSNSSSFSVVKIGKKSKPNYFKEITTFYDEQNRPLAKCFNGVDIDYKMRTYSYGKDINSNNQAVNIRNISVEGLKRTDNDLADESLKFISAFGQWKKLSDEMQCVTDVKSAKKLAVFKTVYSNNKSRDISIIEYPLNKNKENKTNKKILNLRINQNSHKYKVEQLSNSPNISILSNDEFFPYRFLTDEEKCRELSYFFLRKKGLDNLGLKVQIPSHEVGADAAAHFSSMDSAIRWRKVPEYKPIVMVAAHEVEHAAQHSLIGRLTGGESGYELKCREKFGKIKDKNERFEAIRCFDAQKSYPMPFDPDYAVKHDENYLEIKANEAGFKAYKEYFKGQNALKQIFPYFPDSKNMF